MLEQLLPNVSLIWDQVWESTLETLYMTFVTALIAGILGIALGIVLLVTQEGGLLENRSLYFTLDKIVNIFRSLPFIILIGLVVNLTRLIVGTSIGSTAALVPLTIATTPFYARQVQNALLEVDPGVVEAAQAMGCSSWEIIFHVYLREGLVGIIRISAVTIINLIGLTTMAGYVAGGGLGNLAITRGYNRYQFDVTLICTLIILLIVFISQGLGNILIKKFDHSNAGND